MDHEHGHAVDATRRQTCCLLPGSEHCQPLRRDTNVLVLARLSELRAISNSNLLLSLLSATFLGTQIVCLITVATPHRDHAETVLFHRIEFISAFSFALVTVLSVVCAPERQYASQILLKVLVFFSVGSTCVAALLVIVNLHRYETIAHEIEYTNELFLAGAESLVVCAILRVQDRAGGRLLAGRRLIVLVCGRLAARHLQPPGLGGEAGARARVLVQHCLCVRHLLVLHGQHGGGGPAEARDHAGARGPHRRYRQLFAERGARPRRGGVVHAADLATRATGHPLIVPL